MTKIENELNKSKYDLTTYQVKLIEKFMEKLLQEERKEIIEVLKKAEIECSGSCGAGCEYAVKNLIEKLEKIT